MTISASARDDLLAHFPVDPSRVTAIPLAADSHFRPQPATEIARVRAIVGEMPLLVPGIGAQGGDIAATVKAGRTAARTGLMINSSRAILYAGQGEDFASAARRVTDETRSAINLHR